MSKNIIKLTKQAVFDLLEDENTKKIEEYSTKHDCHAEVYVCKKNNKFYKFTIEFSYNDGIQIYGDFVEAVEVKEVEKVIKDWEPV